MLWLMVIIWVYEGWKWDVFGGWPSWVVSFWLVKVRHVPVAAAAVVTVQVVFCSPLVFACMSVLSHGLDACGFRWPWMVLPNGELAGFDLNRYWLERYLAGNTPDVVDHICRAAMSVYL